MPTEVIIGRSQVSPLKIPDDKLGVSGKHVKLTVNDNGDLKLEDLGSANGTFLRNEDGDFERIYTKEILESDVIRLGNDGANSYVFTARRAFHPDDSYYYEFKQLQKFLKLSKEEELKKERWANAASWIISAGAFIVWAIIELVSWIFGFSTDPNKRMFIMMGVPPVLKILLGNFSKGKKKVRQKREKFLLCPKCGRRISEFDVEHGQCSKCKAK